MFVIRRDSHNPLLSPRRERPWEAVATFNPSAVQASDGVRLYYRALGNPDALQTPTASLSSIGMAFSEDGVHFHSRQQVIVPEEPWEAFGCEDPRVTHFKAVGTASIPRLVAILLVQTISKSHLLSAISRMRSLSGISSHPLMQKPRHYSLSVLMAMWSCFLPPIQIGLLIIRGRR